MTDIGFGSNIRFPAGWHYKVFLYDFRQIIDRNKYSFAFIYGTLGYPHHWRAFLNDLINSVMSVPYFERRPSNRTDGVSAEEKGTEPLPAKAWERRPFVRLTQSYKQFSDDSSLCAAAHNAGMDGADAAVRRAPASVRTFFPSQGEPSPETERRPVPRPSAYPHNTAQSDIPPAPPDRCDSLLSQSALHRLP